MILDLCHNKFLKESNEELYASDSLFKPYYQIANSPFFGTSNSGKNLFKYQQNVT